MSGGIIQVVDPVTGDTVYRDVATGEEISRTPAVPGTPTQASGPLQGSTTTTDGPANQSQGPRVIPGYNAPSAPYATNGQPSGPQGPDPSKRLFPGSETIAGPNGTSIYHYTDGTFSQPFQKGADPNFRGQLTTIGGSLKLIDPITGAVIQDYGPSGTGASGASAAVSRQNSIDQIAEQRRQYNETFGYNKAVNDQKSAADAADRTLKEQQGAASLAQQNNQFLATLGSKPETLIRYLRALRDPAFSNTPLGTGSALGANDLPRGDVPRDGAPNMGIGAFERSQFGGPSSSPASSAAGASSTPPALTGAPNLIAQPNYIDQKMQPNTDPFASLRAPGGVLAPSVGAPSPGFTQQSALALANQAPGTLSINGGGGTAPFVRNAAQNDMVYLPNPLATPVQMQNGENVAAGARNGYAQGGIIPEKVVGVGQDSGQTYQFGEKGTEAVMSNDMLQKLMAVAGKVDFHQKGSDGKSSRITMTLNGPPKLDKPKSDMPMMGKMNSYAAGGTIGYSGGKNDYNPQVFNPNDLQSYLQTPGIPLPPQVNMLTGGGQSLIPSAQSLHNALPSEVAIYGDWLNTDANVQSQDAFALAKRLAPTATGVRTPSYGN